ncbi:MAG TPA: replication initiator protein A [Oligoflexia bacterium]|nr:replication initiator protein A [Oligoflexia bacterium]HMP47419.1 replication initiator protein A [Oligoflexia bacterium]
MGESTEMINKQSRETSQSRVSEGVVISSKSSTKRSMVPLSRTSSKSISRDEMNLAEFPLAVLSTRVDTSVKTLEFTDYSRSPSGEMIERRWIITGADKFGLPTATDDDVILGLIRLTMDQGFRNPKVYFTRYELLKTLRWSTEGRSYQRLVKSLDRLSGVRIRSSNSFYDNLSKSYQTSNFGIIDAYEINDERASKSAPSSNSRSWKNNAVQTDAPSSEKNSFFIWSEMIFDSFKSGYIKKLDLDLYFSLKSAISRRLYRYLDKHFYFKNVIEAHLFTLAFEKIGLSRSCKYVSSIRQQLTPALKELVDSGFLSSYEFHGDGNSSMIRFISSNGTASLSSYSSGQIKNQHQKADVQNGPFVVQKNTSNADLSGDYPDRSENKGEKNSSGSFRVFKNNSVNNSVHDVGYNGSGLSRSEISKPFQSDFIESFKKESQNQDDRELLEQLRNEISVLLIERGILQRQVPKLIGHHGKESLLKVLKIISYFDDLVRNSDKKVSINPIGFLYRAVESPYKITLPGELKTGELKSSGGVKSSSDTLSAPRGSSFESSRRIRPEHKVFRATRRKTTLSQSENISSENAGSSLSFDPVIYPECKVDKKKTDTTSSRDKYRLYIENELNCIMTRMSPIELGELFAETESKMKSLKKILQPTRFQEAIEACVRDELRRRFCLPEYEKWVRGGPKGPLEIF